MPAITLPDGSVRSYRHPVTPAEVAGGAARARRAVRLERRVMVRIFAVMLLSTAIGGIVFNATIVGMPKLFDERLPDMAGDMLGIGAIVSVVYVIAAMAQLLVGRLIDRHPIRAVFVPLALAQVPLLWLAGVTGGWALVAVAVVMMFAAFGLTPTNDAIVARYIDERWRSRVYAVKYVISFGASATAVPMLAILRAGAGSHPAYLCLAGIGVGVAAAALCFPARPEEAVRAAPAAVPAE